jgi:hypothetical protein
VSGARALTQAPPARAVPLTRPSRPRSFVDFDSRGRSESIALMDRATLNDISPTQMLRNFEGGVWLVWQYAASVRVRVNYKRGTNQVVSAILFDEIATTGGSS